MLNKLAGDIISRIMEKIASEDLHNMLMHLLPGIATGVGTYAVGSANAAKGAVEGIAKGQAISSIKRPLADKLVGQQARSFATPGVGALAAGLAASGGDDLWPVSIAGMLGGAGLASGAVEEAAGHALKNKRIRDDYAVGADYALQKLLDPKNAKEMSELVPTSDGVPAFHAGTLAEDAKDGKYYLPTEKDINKKKIKGIIGDMLQESDEPELLDPSLESLYRVTRPNSRQGRI